MPRSLALRALVLRSAWGDANYVLAACCNAAPGAQIACEIAAIAPESVGKITQLLEHWGVHLSFQGHLGADEERGGRKHRAIRMPIANACNRIHGAALWAWPPHCWLSRRRPHRNPVNTL